MKPLFGWLKPHYVYAPGTLWRRIFLREAAERDGQAVVQLPWGAELKVWLSDAVSREIWKQRIFDLALSELIWRLADRGEAALDVGGHVGYMANLLACRLGAEGTVDTFEPHPQVRARLLENVALLQARADTAKVTVHGCAISARPGTARLVESDYFAINQGTAKLETDVATTTTKTHEVPVNTLDVLMAGRQFAVMKVDVEGEEAGVFQGAEQLLKARAIRHIIYEDHTAGKSGLPQQLMEHGYTVMGVGYRFTGLELTPHTQPPPVDLRWESANYLATLAPEEVRAKIRRRGWQVLRRAG